MDPNKKKKQMAQGIGLFHDASFTIKKWLQLNQVFNANPTISEN